MGLDMEMMSQNSGYRIEWRKANQIFNWLQNRMKEKIEDEYFEFENCEYYDFDRQDIIDLKNICEKVNKIKTNDYSEQNLPTCCGFFFGSTDYDEWYYKELEWTAIELQNMLNTSDKNEIYTFWGWW